MFAYTQVFSLIDDFLPLLPPNSVPAIDASSPVLDTPQPRNRLPPGYNANGGGSNDGGAMSPTQGSAAASAMGGGGGGGGEAGGDTDTVVTMGFATPTDVAPIMAVSDASDGMKPSGSGGHTKAGSAANDRHGGNGGGSGSGGGNNGGHARSRDDDSASNSSFNSAASSLTADWTVVNQSVVNAAQGQGGESGTGRQSYPTRPPFQNPGNMGIVGQEKDGMVLIARNAYHMAADGSDRVVLRTCIDLFNLRSREHVPLYIHPTVMHCVGAAINPERNLLTFTTLSVSVRGPVRDTTGELLDEDTEYYESWMVEVLPQAQCYSLDMRSKLHQRVQFLYPTPKDKEKDKDKDKDRRKSLAVPKTVTSWFIFSLDSNFIQLYEINLRRRDNGPGYKISGEPSHLRDLVRKQLWFEFDLQANTLTTIAQRPTARGPNAFVMQCIAFPNNRPEVVFETALKVTLPKAMEADPRLYTCMPGLLVLPSINLHIRHVKMRGTGGCIVQQSFPEGTSGPPRIDVIVHILHHRTKLEFSIPLNNMSPAVVRNTRALACSFYDFLMVYIPGHYLQLIDCNIDHDPSRSITVSGGHLASHLPQHHDEEPPPTVTCFDALTSEPPALNVPDTRGRHMVDCSTGVVYEFNIARDALLALFSQESPYMLTHAAHLILVHMRDTPLAEALISELAARKPSHLSTELMKEYMIGASYVHACEANMDPIFLRTIPLSSLPCFSDVRRREDIPLNEPRSAQLHSCVYTPMEAPSVPSTIVESPRRFATRSIAVVNKGSDTPITPEKRPEAANESPSQRGEMTMMRRLVNRFLSPDANRTPEVPRITTVSVEEREENEDMPSPAAQSFRDALTDHFTVLHPRTKKPVCASAASEYHVAQGVQSTKFYNLIAPCLPAHGDHVSLMTLENLFSALEEINFSYPRGFNGQFVRLGYRCLSRVLFMQYIERGIFRMTPKLLADLIDSVPSDVAFLLALRVPDTAKAARVLFDHPEHHAYLLELYSSQLPLGVTESKGSNTDEYEFVPLGLYLKALNAAPIALKQPADVARVNDLLAHSARPLPSRDTPGPMPVTPTRVPREQRRTSRGAEEGSGLVKSRTGSQLADAANPGASSPGNAGVGGNDGDERDNYRVRGNTNEWTEPDTPGGPPFVDAVDTLRLDDGVPLSVDSPSAGARGASQRFNFELSRTGSLTDNNNAKNPSRSNSGITASTMGGSARASPRAGNDSAFGSPSLALPSELRTPGSRFTRTTGGGGNSDAALDRTQTAEFVDAPSDISRPASPGAEGTTPPTTGSTVVADTPTSAQAANAARAEFLASSAAARAARDGTNSGAASNASASAPVPMSGSALGVLPSTMQQSTAVDTNFATASSNDPPTPAVSDGSNAGTPVTRSIMPPSGSGHVLTLQVVAEDGTPITEHVPTAAEVNDVSGFLTAPPSPRRQTPEAES